MSCTIEIPLVNGRGRAVIDAADWHIVGGYRWYANGSGYAYAVLHPKPKQKNVLLHRMIMGDPEGLEVDHVNGDKSDNRRSNLRLASRRQNQANTRARAKASELKGVYPAGERWRAAISIDGKYVHLGIYATREQAALVYNGAARVLFRDFAKLNEMEGCDVSA